MSDDSAVKKPERQEIERKIRELIVTMHHLDIQPEMLEEELSKLDSIQTVELVVKMEEAFGVMFNDMDLAAENFLTISSIVAMVSRKMEESR